jgi:hypothetical protein
LKGELREPHTTRSLGVAPPSMALQIVVLFAIVHVIETLRATMNRERKIGKNKNY